MARHRKASPTHRTRRRFTAMTLAVVGLAGLGLASAAQLNVTSGSLAAGTAVVGSCQAADHPVSVGFATTWTGSPPAYRASAVTLSGIDYDCNGKTVQVQVIGPTPTMTGLTGQLTILPAGNGSITLNFIAADRPTAASITSVAVVIHS